MSVYERGVCSIDDCSQSAWSRGFCHKHYKRLQVHGDPLHIELTEKGVPLEFFNKSMLIETDNCILWKYATLKSGYGNVCINKKSCRVTRMALEHHVGTAPEDKPFALHLPLVCHNRLCFNYRHLRWGTHKENMADKRIDGTHKVRKYVTKGKGVDRG